MSASQVYKYFLKNGTVLEKGLKKCKDFKKCKTVMTT